MVKKAVDFITRGIWEKHPDEYKSNKIRWAVRQFKILILMIQGTGQHAIAVRCAALTFYTLMSLVPILALVFGVVKGFGLDTNFNEYLFETFPQHSEIINYVIEFANNMLAKTKGGVVAAFGFVVLIWAVMRVFGNVENAFNHIWEVRRPRSITRKFSDYIAVVFITPILWIISNSMIIYIKGRLSEYTGSTAMDILFASLSMIATWIMFAFIYYVMPNTKVKIKCAFMGGVIAGIFFQLFQIGYLYVQSRVTAYNAIYGSFAALPLLLIWMQISWQIVLMGAELSFAYQNIAKYEQERISANMSVDSRRKIMLASMVVIIRHFVKNNGPATSEIVAEELNLPVRVVRDVIFDLETAGMIIPVTSTDNEKVSMYVPGKDINQISVYDVITSVETSGENSMLPEDQTDINAVSEILNKVREDGYASDQNILLRDIV